MCNRWLSEGKCDQILYLCWCCWCPYFLYSYTVVVIIIITVMSNAITKMCVCVGGRREGGVGVQFPVYLTNQQNEQMSYTENCLIFH